MIGPTCPKCGRVGHPTRAVNRFRSADEPTMFRAVYGITAPLRSTRAQAEADQCAWQAEGAA
jgi:hypothetical protein